MVGSGGKKGGEGDRGKETEERQTSDQPALPHSPCPRARCSRANLTADQRTRAPYTLRVTPTGTETRGNRVRR